MAFIDTTYRRALQGAVALLPKSLLWQTFCLMALLMVGVLYAWSHIIRHFQEGPRAASTARMVVSVVNLTRTALINAEPARRQELLIDLAALEGIRIYPAESEDRLSPLIKQRGMSLVVKDIRRQLGARTRFASSWEGLEGFWVSFRLDPDDPDEYWVMLPAERLEQASPLEWLGWGAAALLLALAAAYLVVSRVARPLGAVAGAARLVGQGKTPPRLAEQGPQEIVAVAHAFNQMAGDLARLDADRALILAGVSHDLRTPLARLRLGVEMSGAPESEVTAMVTDIEEMDRIIGQFLDFGRDEVAEALQTVDLVALIRDIASSYTRRGVDLRLTLLATAHVSGRELPLRRALNNLVDNALRYAGVDQAIDIVLAQDESGGFRLEVADRGPGIPPQEVERMKQPFTRLDAARTNTKGAGLGLAIVDRTMKRLGGSFKLIPREGGGLRAQLVFVASGTHKQTQPARMRPSFLEESSR